MQTVMGSSGKLAAFIVNTGRIFNLVSVINNGTTSTKSNTIANIYAKFVLNRFFYLLLTCLLLLPPGLVWAQKTEALPKVYGKKAVKKYAQTITAAELQEHLNILASAAYGGRGNGQEGIELAGKYLADEFAAIGIPPFNGSYYWPYTLLQQAWNNPQVTINGKEYTFMEDFYCFARSNGMADYTTSEVLFLGYGIADARYSDYKTPDGNPIDVSGKVLVILNGEPKLPDGNFAITGSPTPSDWTTNWRKKLETATQKGAKALLVVVKDMEKNIAQYSHYINGSSFELKDLATQTNNNGNTRLNSVYISTQMAEELLQRKLPDIEANLGKQPLNFTAAANLRLNLSKKNAEITGKNVLGFIEGTDLKDEVLVITAHYDHLGTENGYIYYGADDDGSGTVALLEIAEAFWKAKKEGKGPRRSVLIMPVSGEEKGLLGSQYYTDINPAVPLQNTIANLNIDMIGRIDPQHKDGNYVYIIGSDKLSTELHRINEKVNKTFTKLTLDYTYNDENDPNRFYYRSDHYNFAKNNVPVIFYFNGTHDDYHQPSDTVDKIAFGAMQKRAQLVFYTAWQLANQTRRIQVDANKK
ncbi:peptidase M28 [Sphingobacteriales bacterium UPWRP_1]|nr:peptidase M28 [Sphingobacteriales bacterium UPWRP_1]